LTKAVEDLRSTIGAGAGSNGGFGANGSGTGGPSTHGSGGGGQGFGPMVNASFGNFINRTPAQAGMIRGGVAAVGASFGSYGQGQMGGQVQMSSFVQRQAMGAPVGMNYQAAGNAIRFGTYGGHGQNLNAGALNAADATMGGSILGAASGSWNPSSTNFGRAVTSAANLYGYANPGQGYAASAQMAAQQYNPQTSMAMMQAGMAPALNRGGGQKSSAQIFQNWSQRQFGKNAVNPKDLAWAMRSGGVGDVNFQGIYQQNAPQFEAAYAATNALMFGAGKNAPGMSAAAANRLMNQAERGNTSQMKRAQATLSRYHVGTSDQQKIQNLGATQTGRSSDVANSFNAGLTLATSSLTQFNNALTSIINMPGINQAIGGAGGFSGGIGTLSNGGNMAMAGGGIAGFAKGALGGAKEDVGLAVAGRFGGAMGMSAALAAGAKPVWVVGSSAGGIGGGMPGGVPGAAGKPALGGSVEGIASMIAPVAAAVIGTQVVSYAVAKGIKALENHIPAKSTVGKNLRGLQKTDSSYGNVPVVSSTLRNIQVGTDFAQSLAFSIENWIGGAAHAKTAGHPIGKSGGGVIGGLDTGADTVHAMLRPQEGVLVPGATRAMGGPAGIDAINRRYGGGGKNLRGHYAQGGVTGNTVASYAASQSGPGNKNLYTWGGGSLGAWDCSGFSAYVYEKYGFFPEKPGSRHGTSESQYSDSLLKAAPDQPGALVFFDTHDGQAAPSHVGVSLGGGKYAGADGPQGAPNAIGSSSGAMGFRIPKKGFSSSAGAVAAASSKGTGTKSGDHGGSSGGGAAGGSSSGLSEADNVAAALGGSAGGGGAGGGTTTSSTSSASKTASSPGGGSPALSPGVGNVPANAKSIAAYLMGKGATKIAAAGILGNIMQESGGSPTAGSNPPGAGLIQILGDPGGSLGSELTKTWNYILQNGGIGPVNAAKNPTDAATIFSQQYERPGTPMLANRIASANASYKAGYAGGTSGATPGWHAVGENGVEMVHMRGGEQVLSHSATLASGKLGGHGYASGTAGSTITFGDIHIHYSGSPSDPGAATHNARETVRQIRKQLASEELSDAIASGRTH
jgi:hypothetical protein